VFGDKFSSLIFHLVTELFNHLPMRKIEKMVDYDAMAPITPIILLFLVDDPESAFERELTADTLYNSIAAFETVNEIPKADLRIERVFLAETECKMSSLWKEVTIRENASESSFES
jgi:hypothetical protein